MFRPGQDRYAPGDVLDVAGCPVRLKVDGRSRRVSLRLDAARREVIATAPSARRLKEAVQFASQRAQWIGEAVARLPETLPFAPGQAIEILGRVCRLERAAGPRHQGLKREEGLSLHAWGEGEAFSRSVQRLLRFEALGALGERTRVHCAGLGQPAPKVGVMDARSRWGSCTPAGRGRPASIRYSWRLILAPFEVMDYVAAHESAHLVHADHSPRFWAVVKALTPDVRGPRAWLRANGPRLHAMGR